MGQKTHPTGFRVGIIKPWLSTWYAKVKDYAVFVAEDAKIRKFVKKKLYAAGVSRILIDRKASSTTITVITAKPAVIPTTKPKTRKATGPVAPTAARAFTPRVRPTISVSTML